MKKVARENLFSLSPNSITRGHTMELISSRIRSQDKKKQYFTENTMNPWNSLSQGVFVAPSTKGNGTISWRWVWSMALRYDDDWMEAPWPMAVGILWVVGGGNREERLLMPYLCGFLETFDWSLCETRMVGNTGTWCSRSLGNIGFQGSRL